jgi:hypothetical protein
MGAAADGRRYMDTFRHIGAWGAPTARCLSVVRNAICKGLRAGAPLGRQSLGEIMHSLPSFGNRMRITASLKILARPFYKDDR